MDKPTLGRIAVLSPQVANQIAAGEVVDRPASVLKEILENSIDAGAKHIHIELLNGGMSLIRITDDGMGIAKSDLALSLARHATSKIKNTADLENIMSLGFRGEALASIASVSKLRLISKPQEQNEAYQFRVLGDALEPELLVAAHKDGTTVEVRDLFYNVPVRRRFLKSPKTEFERIDEMVKKSALSHYDVAFSLTQNQKKLRDYPRALTQAARFNRIKKICGTPFVESAYNIDFENNGLRLWGYLGTVQSARRHADCQHFFVNQRSVKDKVISHAIKNAFHQIGASLEGQYPAYVLYLELDPKEVDVNVHPTKHEIRFLQSRLIHDFVSKCVLEVLTQDQEFTQEALEIKTLDLNNDLNTDQALSLSNLDHNNTENRPNHFFEFMHYTLFSTEDELMIIDLKKANNTNYPIPKVKPLLIPKLVNLTAIQIEKLDLLKKLGFDFVKNIKEEWLLSHVPETLPDCIVKLNTNKLDDLFK